MPRRDRVRGRPVRSACWPAARSATRRPAHQHPDLFPSLAQCRARRVRETETQRIATRFDTPSDPVGWIDRTTRKDVHPRHEFDVQRTAASEDFEAPALAAQQDERSGIAWPHYRPTVSAGASTTSLVATGRKNEVPVVRRRSYVGSSGLRAWAGRAVRASAIRRSSRRGARLRFPGLRIEMLQQ